MTKGKYGVALSFYAVLAFVLAILDQTLLCALLLGFVIIAEKDEWLTKQVMQAFFLTLFMSVVNSVLTAINIFHRIPIVGDVFGAILDVIGGAIGLLVLIFAIIGIVKVIKGQNAGIPVFSGWASKALGYIEQKAYTQMPPQAPQQPQYQQMPPQAPQQQYQQMPPQNQQPPQNPQNPQNPQ